MFDYNIPIILIILFIQCGLSISADIISEHPDFVLLRFHHLMKQTTSNITELKVLQNEEFDGNDIYYEMWTNGLNVYNMLKREDLISTFGSSPSFLKAPKQLHVALVAYSMDSTDFNVKTRQLCSGRDVDSYKYKSFFKFLLMAIEHLSQEIQKISLNGVINRVLYRGLEVTFALQKGQQFAFQQFISTSMNETVAYAIFAQGGGKGTTIFEFRGDEQNPIQFGIFLGAHSYYPKEDEILLSPLQIFQVEDVQLKKKTKRYILKSLPLVVPDIPDIPDTELKAYSDRLYIAVIILGVLISAMVLVFIAGFISSLLAKRRKNVSLVI